MPELPEVEAMRQLAEEHCVGGSIVRVTTREVGGGPRDGKFDDKVVAENVSEARLATMLLNRKVIAARRHGKHMWLEFSGNGPCLMMRFGMTGSLAVKGVERFAWQSFSVDEVWPPRFTKLQLDLQHEGNSNGREVQLAFADPRRFGRILIRNKPRAEPPLALLAPDPLVEPPQIADFTSGLRRSSLAVKSLLLDQERVVCGVGNWVADEVLRVARVHPASPGRTLSDGQIASVHAAVLAICRKAVAVKADASRFPRDWLFHCRWGQGSQASSVTLADGNGTVVAFTAVGGRTTAYVPAEQLEGELRVEVTKSAPRKRKSDAPVSKSIEAHEPDAASLKRPAAARARTKSGASSTPSRKRPAGATPAAAAFEVPLRSGAPTTSIEL